MAGQKVRWWTCTGMRTGTMINRTRRLAFGTALIASAVVALTALPASAQEEKGTETDERIAEFNQRLEEARERLQLTDEQVEQLLPVLKESFEATREVLEKHGIDLRNWAEGGRNRRLNLRQLRTLGRDMNEVQEALLEKIEELGFLSDKQFAEFKRVQDEHRKALRDRFRARRGPF